MMIYMIKNDLYDFNIKSSSSPSFFHYSYL